MDKKTYVSKHVSCIPSVLDASCSTMIINAEDIATLTKENESLKTRLENYSMVDVPVENLKPELEALRSENEHLRSDLERMIQLDDCQRQVAIPQYLFKH